MSTKKYRANCEAISDKVKRFADYISRFDNDQDIDQLRARYERVVDLDAEFAQIHREWREASPKSFDNNAEEEFENLYFAAIGAARKIIANHDRPVSQNSNNSTAQTVIRLPAINLTSFSGALDEWLGYRDNFETLIHDNQTLTDAQKLHYLKASLKGDALQVIHSIQISNQNYGIAWDLVKARYQNKKLIINNHIKSMFNLPKLVGETAHGLRQLLDGMQRHMRALGALGLPIKEWDALVIYLITSKFDPTTGRDWELTKCAGDIPTLDELSTFLNSRCQMLETMRAPKTSNKAQKAFLTNKSICTYCKEEHMIYFCKKFLKLSISDRHNHIKQLQACFNCLKLGHDSNQCKSKSNCRKCNKPHNTLLHFENAGSRISENSTPASGSGQAAFGPDVAGSRGDSTVVCNVAMNNTVILGTAEVKIRDSQGNFQSARALLDSAAQSHFATERLIKRLNLRTKPVDMHVSGIANEDIKIKRRTNLEIFSSFNNFKSNLSCLIIPQITGCVPSFNMDINSFNIPDDIKLADPNFNIAEEVDLLIGAGLYFDLLMQGQIRLGKQLPTIQKTTLGWVISGPFGQRHEQTTKCFFSSTTTLERQLSKFWELEEYSKEAELSPDETSCEKNFVNTTVQTAEGRFMVTLPIKPNGISLLGDSREAAVRRLYSLEKRLNKDKCLRDRYTHFLKEYEQLGHMTQIDESDSANSYYLPHHAVINNAKITTKLRVVFDASANTTSGKSLNDILLTGPSIQDELVSILLRFRCHSYVLTSDITQMYRQVLVTPEQRKLQRILWRENPQQPISTYELNTVTYGMASASFLAIRCLHEAAHINKNLHSDACQIILKDFYVDDLITGDDDQNRLLKHQTEINQILKSCGFQLRKWVSNSKLITKTLQTTNSHQDVLEFDRESHKTLGLNWNPNSDQLGYTVQSIEQRALTKRTILSEISKIYDPLGLIGPVTIHGKILMQRLWQLKLSWDESLPLDLCTKWGKLREQLAKLNDLRVIYVAITIVAPR